MEERNTTNVQLIQQLTQLRLRLADLEAREADCQQERAHWKWTAGLLQLAADYAYDWEYWLSPDGQFQFVSPSCQRITGHTPEEFHQDPGLMLRLVHPDDRAAYKQHLAHELGLNKECAMLEFRIVTDTGEVRWIAHVCQDVYDADGVFLGRRASNRDITSAKRDGLRNAELLAQYAHQEQFLDNLIQNASVGIAVVDREHRYLLVNPAYQGIPGIPDTPMLGRKLEEVFPGVATSVSAMLEEAFRTGRPVRVREYEASVGPGRERTWWNVDMVPLLIADGRARQVLILTQEVTEQVCARQQIEQLHAQTTLREAELRAVIDNVEEGLVIADLSGHILSMNPAALAMHGYNNVQQAQRHLSEYAEAFTLTELDGREIPLEAWPLARALRGERFAHWDVRVCYPESGRTWVGSYSGSLVQDADGKPMLAIITIQDVTARYEAAQERDRLLEELQVFAEELEVQNEELIEARRALETERQRYQSLFQEAPDGYLVTDAQGTIREANQAAATLLGRSVDALVGVGLCAFVAQGQAASFQAILAHLQRSGRVSNWELGIRPCGGAPFPAAVTVAGVTNGGSEGGLRWLLRDVRQRAIAEQSLRESELRFRRLAETSTFGLLVGDEAGHIHYVNGTMLDLLGYEEQELVSGKVRWNDLISPEHVEQHEQALAELLDTGHCTPYQKTFLARDGHPVPALVGASLLEMGPQGEPLVAMFVTDLRALKQSEAELAEERARLGAIFDNAPEGIVVVDAQGRVLMANAAASRIYGQSIPWEQAWHKHTALQHYYPDGGPCDLDDLPLTRSGLDGETLTGVELDILWPDGQRRNLLINSAPVRDEAGRVTGAVGVFQDITARKREQKERAQLARDIQTHAETLRVQNKTLNETRLALARERDVLQTIMEHTHANLAYLDTEFRFVRVNSTYVRESGYTAEELIGRNHFDLFPDAENEVIFRQVRDTGEPVWFQARPFVYTNQPERGVTYWDWTLVPIKDEMGKVEGLVLSLLDVTERERASQALREREAELENLNQTLEQRISERTALAEERAAQLRALAVELTQAEERERRRLAQNLHDNLQQLLAAAKISVNILQEQLGSGPQRMLMGQIDNLLGESIATSRSLTTELSSPILYDAGLGAALCTLGRQTQERHHLPVVVEVDPESEPESEPVRVLLFQAVRELLFNVVKHARASQAYLHMLCEPEDQVCIIVGDDGVGFPILSQRDLNQGFGLFSIRERLELMGGRMEIDSVPGQGTQVRLYAPLHQESSVSRMDETEEEAEAPAPALSREAVIQQIMSLEAMDAALAAPVEDAVQADVIRVLLVDDHEIMREGLASLLVMEENIEIVAQAPDGETAVALAQRLKPDIVVMDVSLPGISGVEATRRILAASNHVSVIGLSMHEKGPIAQAMRDAGAVAYLTKGGPSDALIAAIRSSVGKDREDGAGRPRNAAEEAAHS